MREEGLRPHHGCQTVSTEGCRCAITEGDARGRSRRAELLHRTATVFQKRRQFSRNLSHCTPADVANVGAHAEQLTQLHHKVVMCHRVMLQNGGLSIENRELSARVAEVDGERHGR